MHLRTSFSYQIASLVWKRGMNRQILHSCMNCPSSTNVLVIPHVQMFDMCEAICTDFILMKSTVNDTEF